MELEQFVMFPTISSEEVSYAKLSLEEYRALTAGGGLTQSATTTLSAAARILSAMSTEEYRSLGEAMEAISGDRSVSITDRRAVKALLESGLIEKKGFTRATRYRRVVS